MKKILIPLFIMGCTLNALDLKYDTENISTVRKTEIKIDKFIKKTFTDEFIDFMKSFDWEFELKYTNSAPNGTIMRNHKGFDYTTFKNNWDLGYKLNVVNKYKGDNYIKYIPDFYFSYYKYSNSYSTLVLLQFDEDKYDNTSEYKNELTLSNYFFETGVSKELYKNDFFKYRFGTEIRYQNTNLKISNKSKTYNTDYSVDRINFLITNDLKFIINDKTQTIVGYTNKFTFSNEVTKHIFYFNTNITKEFKIGIELSRDKLLDDGNEDSNLYFKNEIDAGSIYMSYTF